LELKYLELRVLVASDVFLS
jgi:hypothetical protein